MKAGPDRKYTVEFRQAAVRQVLDSGRSMPQVARSLEMSHKTLANWVAKAKLGQPLLKRAPAQPVDEVQAELTRLRQENARLESGRGRLEVGQQVRVKLVSTNVARGCIDFVLVD